MKIELSPIKNLLFVCCVLVLSIIVIHIYKNDIINFFAVTLGPLAKILLIAIGLISYGLLGAYAKTREAGFSGQYNRRSRFFWRSLVFEISIKGFFKIISLILQLLIFSSLLYVIGGYYLSIVLDLVTGKFDASEHIGGFLYIPLFILIVISIAYGMKFYEKLKLLNKEKTRNESLDKEEP